MPSVNLSAADLAVIDAALRDRIATLQGAASESVRRGDRHTASLQMQGTAAVQRLRQRLDRDAVDESTPRFMGAAFGEPY